MHAGNQTRLPGNSSAARSHNETMTELSFGQTRARFSDASSPGDGVDTSLMREARCSPSVAFWINRGTEH